MNNENKWDKFKAYWEEIGKPRIETRKDSDDNWEVTALNPLFFNELEYRIVGDKHWELRLKWINSDRTLPIEYFNVFETWELIDTNKATIFWNQDVDYREGKIIISNESPLNNQVGGNHYSKLKIQPAQYCHANGIGHMAGDAISYITRYKDKDGKKDLLKAIHSLELLIEMEYGNG